MIIHTQHTGFQHGIPSEITPEAVYQSRRELIRHLAAGSAGLALAAWGVREAHAQSPRAGVLTGRHHLQQLCMSAGPTRPTRRRTRARW